MSEWTIIDPDGNRYRVDRINYEADAAGQIGNPFVKHSTPVLRVVPEDRCSMCFGAGRVTDMERRAHGPSLPWRYSDGPYVAGIHSVPGAGFLPDKSCYWCNGVGTVPDGDDLECLVWPMVMAMLGTMSEHDCIEEAARW